MEICCFSILMIDPQTSFLLNTVGLVIEILGAWSLYTAMPSLENNSLESLNAFYRKTRRGYFNLGLFLTMGLLIQYIAGL